MFDELSEVYEGMVDWARRLQREQSLYRELFARTAATRVLDVACGTGHHAELFHTWGLHVDGADVSGSMLARARARCGEPPGLRWIQRGFEQPCPEPGVYDVVLCVGNSLALADSLATAELAVRQMLAALRPGGVVVIQLLNLFALPLGPCVWQKCLVMPTSQGRRLVLKGVHRTERAGYVDVVVIDQDSGRMVHHGSEQLLELSREFLTRVTRSGGAAQVDGYGNFEKLPFEAGASTDLLVVAQKAVGRGTA